MKEIVQNTPALNFTTALKAQYGTNESAFSCMLHKTLKLQQHLTVLWTSIGLGVDNHAATAGAAWTAPSEVMPGF